MDPSGQFDGECDSYERSVGPFGYNVAVRRLPSAVKGDYFLFFIFYLHSVAITSDSQFNADSISMEVERHPRPETESHTPILVLSHKFHRTIDIIRVSTLTVEITQSTTVTCYD